MFAITAIIVMFVNLTINRPAPVIDGGTQTVAVASVR